MSTTLEIPRGAITALIGPERRRQDDPVNLLCGFDTANAGTWSVRRKNLSGIPSFKVARMGQVRTFQLTKSLSLLTVLENMKLGAKDQRGEGFWAGLVPLPLAQAGSEIEARAHELLTRFKLDAKEQDFARIALGRSAQALEMARALMSDPTLVMLDEPMAGVNPALTQSLLEHILDPQGSGDDGAVRRARQCTWSATSPTGWS